jgi:hypothetical protein
VVKTQEIGQLRAPSFFANIRKLAVEDKFVIQTIFGLLCAHYRIAAGRPLRSDKAGCLPAPAFQVDFTQSGKSPGKVTHAIRK